MQVELFEQVLFDASTDTITEESTVWNDNSCSSRSGDAPEFAHNQLEEKQGRFCRLFVGWKVGEDAAFLFTSEGWIGEDHIHAVMVADLVEREAQAVAGVDPGCLQAM